MKEGKKNKSIGDGEFHHISQLCIAMKIAVIVFTVSGFFFFFSVCVNVKEGRVRDRLPCRHTSMTFTGAGETTGRACLRGLHSICFIRDSVCNLCRGGAWQSHRAPHSLIVFNEEQCFRVCVKALFLFVNSCTDAVFLTNLTNKPKTPSTAALSFRTVHCVCWLCLFCDSIAMNLYSCCEKGFQSFCMQCVMVLCKDGKNGICSSFFFFSFWATLMWYVTVKKTDWLKGQQTVHLFEMSNAYQQ